MSIRSCRSFGYTEARQHGANVKSSFTATLAKWSIERPASGVADQTSPYSVKRAEQPSKNCRARALIAEERHATILLRSQVRSLLFSGLKPFPGNTHKTGLSRRSQAHKAKQPAIFASAARAYINAVGRLGKVITSIQISGLPRPLRRRAPLSERTPQAARARIRHRA